jgi:Kef-type K+ transport system membrane component KefB
MVPRGEVGLIFAGAGLAAGVIAEDLYSALVVVVMLTTFVAPPWLKALYAPADPPRGVVELGRSSYLKGKQPWTSASN